MSRIRLLVVVLALLVSGEPVYHTHPLTSGAYDGGASSTICACAAGAQQITTHAPAVVAPEAVVSEQATVVATSASHGVALHLPSRAPPAA